MDRARKGRLRRIRKLMRLLRRGTYRRGLRKGVAAAVEHEEVAFRSRCASVIDVGAHHGQFALLAAELFPSATLYCIEPLEQARIRLERVLADIPRTHVFAVAAGDCARSGSFRVSRATDSSSLLPITSRYTSAFPGTEEEQSVDVPVEPIDALLRDAQVARPCLLKVDVQGAELEVLRGVERTLVRTIDEILIECSFVELYEGQALIDDIICHLKERGFRLVGAHHIVRDGRGHCLQADLHLLRDELAA